MTRHFGGQRARRKRSRLLSEDRHCWLCGVLLDEFSATLDHVTPRSAGGSNRNHNLKVACRPCNEKKSLHRMESIVCLPERGWGIVFVWELYLLEVNAMNVVGFNYDILDAPARKRTQEHAKKIHKLLETTSAGIAEIGRRLHAVRAEIGPQKFQAWLKVEFRWSQATASNFMRVSERFGELDCLDHIQPSALYVLARKRVDERAIEEVVKRARSGEIVTKQEAVEAVAKYEPVAVGTSAAFSAAACEPAPAVDAPPADPPPADPAAELEALVERLLQTGSPEQLEEFAALLFDWAARLKVSSAHRPAEPAKQTPAKQTPANGRRKRRPTAKAG